MEERDHIVEEVRENFTLKTLQERVWRLEAENKELKVQNSILQTQYTSQCETQSDILRTLHANLDENYSKIEESESKIQRLEQQLEDQKQEFRDKLEEERALWEHRIAELQMKNDHLQGELDKVTEFRQNKEAMEAELASLKRQLQEQEEAHTRDVSAFDRRKAIEIDQLKRDMQRSIKDTREVLKARTKDQLDSTTKRTIMENEQMATELIFQSKETERLLDRNQSLIEENAQLRRNLLIHKDLENELARRTHVYQKLIKKMHQRQKIEGDTSATSRELRLDDPPEEDSRSLAENSMELANGPLAQENAQLKRQVEGIQSTLQMVRHEFAQYRRDHATLTQLQDQSTRLIISALYELKNQRECDPFPPATYDEHANWQFTTMTQRQKEYFFRVLLEKLNSSMCGSCFPTGPHSVQNCASNSSLPALTKDKAHDQGGSHFSQFLWSVASGPGGPGGGQAGGPKKEMASKAMQTETEPSDPCFKEGLWSPNSRSVPPAAAAASQLSSAVVCGNVRTWGPRAMSRKPRGVAAGRAV